MLFAIIGTAISALVVGGGIYLLGLVSIVEPPLSDLPLSKHSILQIHSNVS